MRTTTTRTRLDGLRLRARAARVHCTPDTNPSYVPPHATIRLTRRARCSDGWGMPVDAFEAFDTKAGKWRTLPPMKHARSNHTLVWSVEW